MELHDLILKKEVAREGAWEVLARIIIQFLNNIFIEIQGD